MLYSKPNFKSNSFLRKFLWKRPVHAINLALLSGLSFAAETAAQDWIPPSCCPHTDCQSVTPSSVVEVRGGYIVDGVTGVIPHSDPRIQPSRDGLFYACIQSRARPFMKETNARIADRDTELKCLFVPLMG